MAEEKGTGDLLQQLEQFATNMENIAELKATYFHALCRKGLTREEALALTLDYSNNFWQFAFGLSRNDPH